MEADLGSVAPTPAQLLARRPLFIGHRGACALAPENTLPSFDLALRQGVDLVELDYHQSKDGQLVVIHDAELDRTTDVRERWGAKNTRVDSRTADELEALDAGGWFGPEFAGTRIPLLSEALHRIHRAGGVTLIERKAGDAATCVKLLRDDGLINRVVVQSFDWAYLRAFHELEPTQLLAGLGPPTALTDGTRPIETSRALCAPWLDELAKTGASVVVWSNQMTREAVELAHRRGLEVWVYTIDDAELAHQLLDVGVDGLITNDATQLRRTVASRMAT